MPFWPIEPLKTSVTSVGVAVVVGDVLDVVGVDDPQAAGSAAIRNHSGADTNFDLDG